MKKGIAISMILLMPLSYAQSEISFTQLWETTKKYNSKLKQEKSQWEHIQSMSSKANKHWVPQVYLNAQYLSSNSPTMSFFTNLNQKAIRSSDFNPSLLNHPETTQWAQGTLGIRLPLYEGGMRSHMSSSLEKGLQAQGLVTEATKKEVYTQLAKAYLGVLQQLELQKDLIDYEQKISQQLGAYELGKKRNPVGYSGMLGLKSVLNKVASYKDQSSSQLKAYLNEVERLSGEKIEITTLEKESYQKISQILSFNLEEVMKESLQLQARELQENSLNFQAEAQKARLRPQLGVFAETQYVSGDRDQADSQMAGVYLQWQWSHESLGIGSEVKAQKQIERYKTDWLKQQEHSQKKVAWNGPRHCKKTENDYVQPTQC